MHEMALVESVRELIEDAAAREGFSRVRQVRVEIGQLSGIERDAFEFCFGVAMQGGVAAGARLEVVATPGRGACPVCTRETALAVIHDPCAHCGALPVTVISGTAMRVIDLEVE